MRTTDYNLPIFDDTDVADLNDYTEKLANALKGQIDRFGNPLTFKGIVTTVEDLPEDATAGDIYNVTDINKNYVFSGEEWLEYSDAIDNSCQDMISDEYDSTSTYAVGDYCIKDNTLYKCTTAITTAEEWDVTHWTAVKISTELQSKLDKVIIVTEAGTDLNDYKNDGNYFFVNNASLPSNRPANIYGWVEVIGSNGFNVRQFWHRSATINGSAEFETFVRLYNKNADTWSNWAKYQMVEDSGWLEPTLINGSQPTSANYLCRYRKINGIVYIKGVVAGLTGASQLFTLPTGYRPTGYQRFITNAGNTVTTSNVVRIASNGEVLLQNTSNTGTFEITLDGISFVADN